MLFEQKTKEIKVALNDASLTLKHLKYGFTAKSIKIFDYEGRKMVSFMFEGKYSNCFDVLPLTEFEVISE